MPISLRRNGPGGFVLLFPFVEQAAAYELIRLKTDDLTGDMNENFWGMRPLSTANRTLTEEEITHLFSIPTYRCPTRRAPGARDGIYTGAYNDGTTGSNACGPRGDYIAVAYVDRSVTPPTEWSCAAGDPMHSAASPNLLLSALRVALWPADGNVRYWQPRDTFAWLSDGTSNTILIGEKHIHPGICHFLFGDGSVRGISVTTPVGSHADKGPLLMLSCVNDGGVVSIGP